MSLKTGFYNALIIAIGAIILCFLGFYNNFPFLFPDSGTYIFSGCQPYMPGDRPIIYGLFIRYTSMLESLWFVVYAQALIVSYVLFLIFEQFFDSRKKKLLAFISYVFLITFTTGASVNVSQLIPDIFTPVVVLITIFFLNSDRLKVLQTVVLFIIGVIAVSSHNSHLLLVIALVFFYYLYMCFFYLSQVKKQILKHLLLFLPLILCSAFLNNFISLSLGKGFSPPNGSHVFLLGHLAEMGLLDSYLEEVCPWKNYKICNYKDDIPDNFLWDFERSPLYKTGGWEANKDEYTTIIFDMLSRPKYLKKIIIKSINNGFQQLFTFDTGDTPKINDEHPADRAVEFRYKDEYRAYHASKQYGRRLNYEFLNEIQQIVIAIFLFSALVFVITSGSISNDLKIITFLILVALILNAFICASLSGVVARYQSRVIWLLPLPSIIILFKSKFISQFIHE